MSSDVTVNARARMSYPGRLEERERERDPIRVGVAGAGAYGLGLIAQLRQMRGIRASLVIDQDLRRARAALSNAGTPDAEVVEASPGILDDLPQDRTVVGADAALLARSRVEVVVDCTGSPEAGARLAWDCLRARKHVVMVNVEADVVVGAILRREADRAGVVYTTADGDQPSLAAGLVEWLRTLGFQVVCAGKGTSILPPEAAARKLAEPGLGAGHVAYFDGTKSQIEMASVANITGLRIDTPGLRAPRLELEAVAGTLIPREDGGLLAAAGAVEIVNCLAEDGKTLLNPYLQPGVFAVVTSENAATRGLLAGKGCPTSPDGRYALIYRPYHLCGAETPTSILQAVFQGTGTGSPLPTPTADGVAVARRPLPAGAVLDGIGGSTVRGVAFPYAAARAGNMLPVGMAEGVRLTRAVAEGEAVRYEDLEASGDSFLWELRRRQDAACPA